jgi:hypothetical protein
MSALLCGMAMLRETLHKAYHRGSLPVDIDADTDSHTDPESSLRSHPEGVEQDLGLPEDFSTL